MATSQALWTLLLDLLIIITQSGNRYFMDDDNDQGLTALPFDLCFESESNPTSKYLQYVCSDDGLTVTKTKYSDAGCTTATSVATFNKSSAESSCGLYNFECSGNDRYVMTGAYYEYLSKDKDCQSLQSKLPTVLGCFCKSESSSFHASCSDDANGQIISYSDAVCGEVDETSDLSDCSLVMKVSLTFYTMRIYRQIVQCVNPDIVSTTTASGTS